MKTKIWLQGMSSLFLMMTMTLSVIQPGLVGSAYAQPLDDGNTAYDPLTGALAFVGTQPGQAVASMLGVNPSTVSPAKNATAFMAGYASQLGLSDVSADLVVAKTSIEQGGRSTVRYRQTYQGIPVFGGEVIVNTDARGAMLSLSAKTSPRLKVDVNPTLTAANAVATATQMISRYHNLDAKILMTGTPKLQIYDSRLIHADGIAPRLVWSIVVSALEDGVSEVVLVDAHSGAVANHFNQADYVGSTSNQVANASNMKPVSYSNLSNAVLGVPQISIYNINHQAPDPSGPEWPGTLICDQSNSANCNGDLDAKNAYANALDTYNFMKNYLGIDSFDNAGATINSSVHYGVSQAHAFWLTGLHIAAYGDGYAGADDMAGHALGFSLLESGSASTLFLTYQPGAIAESLADMWGEFIDQTNGRGTDTAAVKWVIGENWPSGAQRNMSNPAISPFVHPDKMTSANYYLGDDDSIGIYKNAGVNNKAVFLMTDGGTFNGKTVQGLGIAKVAKIYYEVETHLLASASTYFDLYYAVKQACYNLMGTSGITSQNCDQVRNALDAVQMNITNSATIYPVAQYCPAGKSRSDPTATFFDSLETGTGNWTISPATDSWAQVSGSSTDGLYHFEGPEPSSPSASVAQMTDPVLIPTGDPVYLYFEHWYNFESIGTSYHDGGFVQYSTDNGNTWQHTWPLYAGGQNYGGTLATGRSNPMEGQKAFVEKVRNYVSTTFNLTSLVGQSIRFRWIMSTDSSVSGSGWYVDNIQMYKCITIPNTPALLSPATNALNSNYLPILDWSSAAPNLAYYVFQLSTSSTFATITKEVTTTNSSYAFSTPLLANQRYYWRVRAYDTVHDANAWSAVRYFRTAIHAPVLQSPASKATSLKPLFNWTDVPGAASYTIQVARFSNFKSPVVNTTITKPTSKPFSQYQTITALLPHTTYYWRVRVNATNGPSLWVTKKFVTP